MRKRRLQSRHPGECGVKETKEKEYFRIKVNSSNTAERSIKVRTKKYTKN